MRTITFEVYDENFWVEFSVETQNADTVLSNLFKLKNVRNIYITK